jgi:hypothetical protein
MGVGGFGSKSGNGWYRLLRMRVDGCGRKSRNGIGC